MLNTYCAYEKSYSSAFSLFSMVNYNFNINIYSNHTKNEIIESAENIYLKVLENQDSFEEKEWNELYKLSEETFVEENESLKQGGAGAGLTDND